MDAWPQLLPVPPVGDDTTQIRVLSDALRVTFDAARPDRDFALVELAIDLAATAHHGQRRGSGEPYVCHPLAAAHVVAALGLDAAAVAAAVCHDVVEDTPITREGLAELLGAEVAMLVDGVTKVGRVRSMPESSAKAADLEKMLVAVAGDVRVLLVKLADRLHNVATLGGLPAHKQRRIAIETLELYVPLAHRLGAGDLHRALEDMAFGWAYPEAHAELVVALAGVSPEREARTAEAVEQLTGRLAAAGLDAVVSGRAKSLWSVHRKLVRTDKTVGELFDLVAVRAIVGSVEDCYAALGVMHRLWRPFPGRFKDYIAVPKLNAYQSLHQTVFGPGGPLEVQVRTRDMHVLAERGPAAHALYKDGVALPASTQMDWLERLTEWRDVVDGDEEFLDALRGDLAAGEVMVFTPDGDVVALPAGATPVDFAYAIHSDVGDALVGATVNGRQVGLRHRLASGDVVEARTRSGGLPSADWVGFVVTARAKSRIRRALLRANRDELVPAGRAMVADRLAERGVDVASVSPVRWGQVRSKAGFADVDGLLAAVGSGQVPVQSVVDRLLPPARRKKVARAKGPVEVAEVLVEGLSGLPVRFASCCAPEGTAGQGLIVGFVGSDGAGGRAVAVHRAGCDQAARMAGEAGGAARRVVVSWGDGSGVVPVRWLVQVRGNDRRGLLADVAAAFAVQGIDICEVTVTTDAGGAGAAKFTVRATSGDEVRAAADRVAAIGGVVSSTVTALPPT